MSVAKSCGKTAANRRAGDGLQRAGEEEVAAASPGTRD